LKLVKEYLNKMFTQDSDPIYDLGIGQKQLIENWIKKYQNSREVYTSVYEAKITINNDLSLDIKGNLNLFNIGIEKLPEYIQFNEVTGHVWMNSNKLITLKGCPRIVGGIFICSNNDLESLDYCPIKVKKTFYCDNNKVKFTIEDVRSRCKVTLNIII
jgi:hypothetical protein